MSFKSYYYHNNAANFGTATTTVILGPVDVRAFSHYAIAVQNNLTAASLLGIRVQRCLDHNPGGAGETYTTSAVSGAPNWVDIDSGTMPQFPAAVMGPTSTLMTTAILNHAAWIRVLGGNSATSVNGSIRLVICGMEWNF